MFLVQVISSPSQVVSPDAEEGVPMFNVVKMSFKPTREHGIVNAFKRKK